jgi:sugar lactone lactonase YvrE
MDMYRLLALGTMVGAAAFAQGSFEAKPFIEGTGLHCIHGLTFDADDQLYVGSVVGQSVYRVDRETGAYEVVVGPNDGLADDMEFGPDGALYYTSIIQGAVRRRAPDGTVTTVAEGKPGFNSIAFNAKGRLFSAEVFLGDALYEIDPKGEEPPRMILKDLGGLNGFDFGPDGKLYGPLWFKGQVVRIDVDAAKLEVVADGFGIPAAANFNSKGELFVLDSMRGDIVRVDIKTGEKKNVFKLQTAMDNLAFDSQDRLFVTVMSESAIYEIDLAANKAREVRRDPLGVPADMAIWKDGDKEIVYLADTFALRSFDVATGEVTDIARFVETHLEYPTGIDVTEDHIHTVSFNAGVAQTFDRKSGELLATHRGLIGSMDVAEHPDGSLLVTLLTGGRLVRIAPDGTQSTVTNSLAAPVGIAVDVLGNVYVTNWASGNITQVDVETGDKLGIATGLKQPEGISMLGTRQLLVAETGTQSVVTIDIADGKREVIASDIPMGLGVTPQFPPMGVPTGVVQSASGDFFVSADITDSIWKISKGDE